MIKHELRNWKREETYLVSLWKNSATGGMTVTFLFVRMAVTMSSATWPAFMTGNNQSNLEVKVRNIPVDMLTGQAVVKWIPGFLSPS